MLTLEFPHVLRLIERREFDTIYHEHFSYFSMLAVERLFAEHGLEVFDVEELRTHGGSLRIYAAPVEAKRAAGTRVAAVRKREEAAGLTQLETYTTFDAAAREIRRELVAFLEEARSDGRSVAAYGAAAKGNTLLNYCGIDTSLVEYVADRSPHKQGRYLPGSRLPIHAPEHVARDEAGLPAAARVEPARRDRRADELHPGVGRPLRRPDPAGDGHRLGDSASCSARSSSQSRPSGSSTSS